MVLIKMTFKNGQNCTVRVGIMIREDSVLHKPEMSYFIALYRTVHRQ